jgi:ABC-type Fe3+-citrate transport system substrate-binding protein
MSAGALRIGLLMTIQQEYEHNLVQQIYVSDNLWKIIQTIRDNQVRIVNKAFDGMNGNDAPQTYISKILQISDESGDGGVDTALQAIKKEVALML